MTERLTALLLAVLMLLLPLSAAADAALTVQASVAPAYALAEGLLRGADGVRVRQLVQPQLDCMRLYELSDWDMVQLTAADCCVLWSAGLESFHAALTTAEAGPAVITLAAAAQHAALPDDMADYDYHAHFTGDDPHTYLSLAALRDALDGLHESLVGLYPELRVLLDANLARMRLLISDAQAVLDVLTPSGGMVAALYEGAPVLLAELDMDWAYVYPREPASDVTGADLDELLARLSASGAAAVALERQAPTSLTDALIAAGYEVRLMSTLLTLDAPTLEQYLAALTASAAAVAGA